MLAPHPQPLSPEAGARGARVGCEINGNVSSNDRLGAVRPDRLPGYIGRPPPPRIPPPPMPPTPPIADVIAAVTDDRYEKLRDRLREMFELDKSDLDFGIYRILAARNREIADFLDHRLREVVAATLVRAAGDIEAIDQEIEAASKAAVAAGFDPDDSPKVQTLRDRRAFAVGTSGTSIEADIYNHLATFFGRYYDEGDFISQHRYKGDTYAIPYDGREVVLHWANKGKEGAGKEGATPILEKEGATPILAWPGLIWLAGQPCTYRPDSCRLDRRLCLAKPATMSSTRLRCRLFMPVPGVSVAHFCAEMIR